jgi:hypothetical protein
MLRIKGVGSWYVGYEAWTDEPKFLSRAWFRELTPPWRMGGGLRVRLPIIRIVGHQAVQIGRCARVPLAENPSALSQLGGYDLEVTPDQIGAWGRGDASEVKPAS